MIRPRLLIIASPVTTLMSALRSCDTVVATVVAGISAPSSQSRAAFEL